MIQLLLKLEMLKSLIALKRSYLKFILIANSPLTITSRNFAKKQVINFMHLPAYLGKTKNLDEGIYHQSILILPFSLDVSQQAAEPKINKIQERALRITYKDIESTFSDLLQRELQKDCAVTIHTKNLQILMTEMYKTRNYLNPSFMQEIFCENTTH